jgi:hypothetical protein
MVDRIARRESSRAEIHVPREWSGRSPGRHRVQSRALKGARAHRSHTAAGREVAAAVVAVVAVDVAAVAVAVAVVDITTRPAR